MREGKHTGREAAGMAACSGEAWRGQGGNIVKTALAFFTLILPVRPVCVPRVFQIMTGKM